MSEQALTSPIDRILLCNTYSLDSEEKQRLLLEALNASFQHHFNNCRAYQRLCTGRGFTSTTVFEHYHDFPFLPAELFKTHSSSLRSVDDQNIKVSLQSSATSGVPSTVLVDGITAKRQVRALTSVLATVFGQKRRPFVVLDVDPAGSSGQHIGARGAAVRGFLNLAREVEYCMEGDGTGLALKVEAFKSVINRHIEAGEPIVLLGFTYVLFLWVIKPLLDSGVRFHLPPGSFVAHIGGWKKLEDQQVARADFNHQAALLFGLQEQHVVDFYGFTEQMGVTYPDIAEDRNGGVKVVPAFAEVIVRDPISLAPLPPGKPGFLQFLTPLPHSYPGFSILTSDLGIALDSSALPSGVSGTAFRVLGRAKNAEVRGCGDIMGLKAERSSSRPHTPRALESSESIRLLFDAQGLYTPRDLFSSVNFSDLPTVDSVALLSARLLEGRARLAHYSVDDLIALIAAAAARWADPHGPLAPLIPSGLLFLSQWCASRSLRRIADQSLPLGRGILDGYRSMNARQSLYAQSRGLVCHWLAGNVPLLGMLTLAQSILTRNANLLKASSAFSSVMPILLEAFRGLEVKTVTGRTLRGDDVLSSIAVIYFSREHREASLEFSEAADVRLAWGGREAVEAIMNLPRKYGTEDIIFGPKLSYMAIGKEMLASERDLARMAKFAAIDASVFDQYACASPHTIFVEEGGLHASPRDFALKLADEMRKAAVRIPKQPADPATVTAILGVRAEAELLHECWHSDGSEWTVVYDPDGSSGLSSPCYSRVITVKAIKDILTASEFAHRGIQTVGLALKGERQRTFALRAAQLGAERFPDVGRMTYFDAPWDGMFPIERLVRLVTLGGPL